MARKREPALPAGYPQLLRPGEAAVLLRTSQRVLARLADEGTISAVRTPGGRRCYDADEIRSLARRLRLT